MEQCFTRATRHFFPEGEVSETDFQRAGAALSASFFREETRSLHASVSVFKFGPQKHTDRHRQNHKTAQEYSSDVGFVE